MGIRTVFYLDDTIIMAQSCVVALQHHDQVVKLLSQLGFILNLEKSDLSLTHQITFLGLRWDTVALPEDKVSCLQSDA